MFNPCLFASRLPFVKGAVGPGAETSGGCANRSLSSRAVSCTVEYCGHPALASAHPPRIFFHMPDHDRRFVQIADALRETNPWTNNEWLCRPDLVAAEKLLLVRANMDPGHCHPFHHHPHREEIIYVIYGRAEQWVGHTFRILGPGEMAHIPPGVVHATYNPHAEPLVFLAVLSPAKLPAGQAEAPDPVDNSTEEPWASLRRGRPECRVRATA